MEQRKPRPDAMLPRDGHVVGSLRAPVGGDALRAVQLQDEQIQDAALDVPQLAQSGSCSLYTTSW